MTECNEIKKIGSDWVTSEIDNRKKKYFEISKHKRIFKCPMENCGKLFREKGNLRTHIRVHTGERPFKCPFDNCMKSFITLGNLKSHMTNHTGSKPFRCRFEGCEKQYSRLCRLRIHERTHTGNKPFKCPQTDCDKMFNEKGNLKTHFRIHSGEKPFKCNFEGCEQSFKAHGHLKDHMKRHFNIKPFQCGNCHANFARNSTLKMHLNTHSKEHNSSGIKNNIKIKSNINDANRNNNNIENSINLQATKNLQENFNIPNVYLSNPSQDMNKNLSFANIEVSNKIDFKFKNFKESDEMSFSNYYSKAKRVMERNFDSGTMELKEEFQADPTNDEIKMNLDPSSILLNYLNHLLNMGADANNVIILLDLSVRLNISVEWLLAFAEMNIPLTFLQRVNLYLYNRYCNAIKQIGVNENPAEILINQTMNSLYIKNNLNNHFMNQITFPKIDPINDINILKHNSLSNTFCNL